MCKAIKYKISESYNTCPQGQVLFLQSEKK